MTASGPIERVLVAGATGDTGLRVLDRLAPTDLAVRATTRSSSRSVERTLEARGADEIVVGDLLAPATATRAVESCDVVVSAVGTSPLELPGTDEYVDGRGNCNLVDAARNEGVARVVLLSSLGGGDDRGSLMARAFRAVLPGVVAAKSRAETALRESGVPYTIIRPGVLLDVGARGDVQVADAGTGLWGAVPRGDVARLLCAAPFTPAARNWTCEVVVNPLQRDLSLDVAWGEPRAHVEIGDDRAGR